MKHTYIFVIIFFVVNISLQAQEFEDYHPFPYDSVFFELSTPNEDTFEALMPIVKSGNVNDMLLPINNTPHWIDIIWNGSDVYGEFPVKSWLGEVSYESQRIQFVTAFLDTIVIRTNMDLMTSDTIDYYQAIDYYEVYNPQQKLVIHYDNLLVTTDDEIKEYSFELLSEGSGSFSSDFDIESIPFRISKEHGILNTPSFYYFPFCQEFVYKDLAENVLDQSTLNAYKVFHLNPGDEIHSFYESTPNVGPSYIRKYYKKVCVSEAYDESLERIIQVNDVWSLKKKFTLIDNMNFEHVIEPNFIQQKDTFYLNDFLGINKALPDGFGESVEDSGTFYDEEHGYFEMVLGSGAWLNNGSIEVGPFLDGNYDEYRYSLDYSEVYYSGNYSDGSNATFYVYRPQYSNFNGEEWGEPFSDAFLLALEEEKLTPNFQLIFKDGTNAIQVESEQFFESARIYDLNGKFVKYISSEELKYDISIIDLEQGIYVFLVWDGKKAHSIKFFK